MNKNLTICIPTHCVKTEREGQYVGMHQQVPTAPSNKLILNILHDLFHKTQLDITTPIHIGFDKRSYRDIDKEYENNLKLLQNIYPNLKIIVNETDHDDPIITAPNNFLKLIDSVETKYYLFWEHDWIFKISININKIIDEMENNSEINWIRFNAHKNDNSVIVVGDGLQFIPEQFLNDRVSKNINLMRTCQWSNNPYICRADIFKKWWKTFIYPTREEGGFVEGPLNVFYKFYIQKMGLENALKTFKCFVYGNWGDEPTVAHLNGYWVR